MVIRSILSAVIVSLSFFSAQGQTVDPAIIATAGTLGGTYTNTSLCVSCDSTITKLQLTPDGKGWGGDFVLTTMNMYSDATKKYTSKHIGHWFLLKDNVAGDNTTIIVVHINYEDEVERFPLYLVQKDGNLLELNEQSTERYPQYIYKDKKTNDLYIAREHAKPVALEPMMHYKDAAKGFKDPTISHIYRKK